MNLNGCDIEDSSFPDRLALLENNMGICNNANIP